MFFNLGSRFGYFLTDFSFYLILLLITVLATTFAFWKILKSKLPPNRQKIAIAATVTILAIILVFTALEAYFRYVYDVSDGLGFLKVNGKWHARHVVHNNYFFRDRDFQTEKEPGVTRIGVLGDSITFGGGIEKVEDRFSNILEKKLREAGKNVEIYNLGKPGYDTTGEVEEYNKVRHLGFDILIWEYFINDVQPKNNSTGTPIIENNSKQGKIVTFLSNHSYFFDFLYWRFSSKYQETFRELRTADIAQYSNDIVLKEHKEEIANFVNTLRSDKTKIIVIMFPSNFLLGPNYPEYVHKLMADVFKENQVDIFVDLLPDLKGRDKTQLIASKFDPHPNEFVHHLAAEKLFNEILPLLATSSPSVR